MYSVNGLNYLFPECFMPLFFVLIAWSFFWKGLALWHAARKNAGGWFIVLLLVNTVGILEMIYIFGVAKIKSEKLFK